jgi:hypothetical protein
MSKLRVFLFVACASLAGSVAMADDCDWYYARGWTTADCPGPGPGSSPAAPAPADSGATCADATQAGCDAFYGVNPITQNSYLTYLEAYGSFTNPGQNVSSGYINCQFVGGYGFPEFSSDLSVDFVSSGQINFKLQTPIFGYYGWYYYPFHIVPYSCFAVVIYSDGSALSSLFTYQPQ